MQYMESSFVPSSEPNSRFFILFSKIFFFSLQSNQTNLVKIWLNFLV